MTPPLLSVQNLDIAFSAQGSSLVKDVSFDLHSGKTMALVGESGSGKSITALSILKLLPLAGTYYPQGKVLFDQQDLLALDNKALQHVRGKRISMIFQEPMTALNPLHTIEKQIGEMLKIHQSLSPESIKNKTLSWLKKVGIPDPKRRLNNYPHELSGGQRQRVMIAMALINEPQVLIADEPTTALDVTVQKQILDLIEQLKKELNMAVLLISHDLGVVKHYSDQIAVMYQGEIVESQPTEALFKAPKHSYTQALLEAEPSGKPVACKSSGPHLEAKQVGVSFALKKSFFGKTLEALIAVNNVSLNVAQGETLGIIGESGSGKSTLAMAILQLQKCSGEIFLADQALHNMPKKQLRSIRKHLQVVFQDPFASLSPRMTIAQIIAEGLHIHHPKMSNEEADNNVIDIMTEVELNPEERHRYPHEFSGGQRQRIAIARALILQPNVIVLDEPTSALDRAVQAQVINLLRSLQEKYAITYLFISHDLKVVRTIAHRIMVMKNGQVIEQGETEKLLTAPKESYTKALLEAAL